MQCFVQDSIPFANIFLDMKLDGYTFYMKKNSQILIMNFTKPRDIGYVSYFFTLKKYAQEWIAKLPLDKDVKWEEEFYVDKISYKDIYTFARSCNFAKNVELFLMGDNFEHVVPSEHILIDPRKQKIAGIGRNSNCPCGSGKKWKKCCMKKIYIR